ncbi:MAG: FtsQ-type POTRA domain-containing protein [Bdellovibrionales bacterium]|nr:FtsQ-type POTRA domain-containing protein [Bdellovibrionales bacterium]
MKKGLGAWLGFLLTSLFLWGAYWTVRGPWFSISKVDINLDPTSSQDVLFERIRADLQEEIKSYYGQKAWDISIKNVLVQVETDPRVKKASVIRQFPDGLTIRIKPRDPVLGLRDNRGLIHPVASDGSLLPPLAPLDAPDLPYLWGDEFFKKPEMRLRAIKLIEEMPAQGRVSVASISEIHYRLKEGFALFLIGKNPKILVGENGFKKKVGRIEQVLDYLDEHQIEGRVIDARFSKKVVVRLRNHL